MAKNKKQNNAKAKKSNKITNANANNFNDNIGFENDDNTDAKNCK